MSLIAAFSNVFSDESFSFDAGLNGDSQSVGGAAATVLGGAGLLAGAWRWAAAPAVVETGTAAFAGTAGGVGSMGLAATLAGAFAPVVGLFALSASSLGAEDWRHPETFAEGPLNPGFSTGGSPANVKSPKRWELPVDDAAGKSTAYTTPQAESSSTRSNPTFLPAFNDLLDVNKRPGVAAPLDLPTAMYAERPENPDYPYKDLSDQELLKVHRGLIEKAVWDVVGQDKPSGVLDTDDYVQEASLALLHAREKYDATKGAFSTYATIWMRSEVKRHREEVLGFDKSARASRGYGTPVARFRRDVKNATDDFVNVNNRLPTQSDLADTLGMDHTAFRKAFDAAIPKQMVSLEDLQVYEHDVARFEAGYRPWAAHPAHADRYGYNPDDPTTYEADTLVHVMDEQQANVLWGAAYNLRGSDQATTPMARTWVNHPVTEEPTLATRGGVALSLRYVDGFKTIEIAKHLGVGSIRVNQLEADALKKLREQLPLDLAP